jgi:general secretion pathway protein I
MTRPPGRRRQAGFTLLEVLVALAILSFAVVAFIQGFAQGLRLLKLSGDHQQAMLLADLKAREIITPAQGHDEGVEGDYHWERTTTAVEAPELVTATGGVPPWRIFQIDVRVQWGGGRQVELATLRTVPAQLVEITEPVGSTSAAPAGTLARPSATRGSPR